MRNIFCPYILCLLLLFLGSHSTVNAANEYPIVFVHGFMGWGEDEMGSYKYWGGNHDLMETLRAEGYTVYTVSVGPVSSNWERALEVYYQLKGGQLDYGKAHADRYGIIQKPEGKEYPGLYPEWGPENQVHMVGHSMGGQTIRMLQYILTNTFYEDDEQTIPEETLILNQSLSGYIKSITSISAPHNGTTLSNIVVRSVPFLQNIIGLAAVVGTDFYDFDLQHWGFDRMNGESWMDYYKRMREHSAWGTTNISAWDLSIEGARQLNTEIQSDPDLYYFSFVCSTTHLDSVSGNHLPDPGTGFILKAKARLIGMQTAYWADGTATDSTWYENDGVVNTVSQYGPTSGLNGPDVITNYKPEEPLIPGQWYIIDKLKMDHWHVVGHSRSMQEEDWARITRIYIDHCGRLWQLP